MIHRLHLDDWRAICHYLGMLIWMCAAAMVIPLVVGLALGEDEAAANFLLSIGTSLVLGGVLAMCRVERGPLDWCQSIVITGLVWVVFAGIGCIPLYLSGCYLTPLDAFFDAVSAFTTTGLSTCADLDHMATSVVLWRSLMCLAGCVGVIVIALALGVFGSGAVVASLYRAEAREGQVMPEIKQTSQFIVVLAAAVVGIGTLVVLVPMLLQGLPFGSALANAFIVTVASFSTGGMTNHSLGLMYYHSWPLEIMTVLLAAFGCVNFMLFGNIWSKGDARPFFKDLEVRTFAIWGVALAVLLAFALAGNDYFGSLGSELRRGGYLMLSGTFNIGLSTMYAGQELYAIGSGALFVIILSMVVAGSTSSASGGLKTLRIGIIAKGVVQMVRETLAPDRARPRTFYHHFGRRLLDSETVSAAMLIVLLYIVTYGIGAVVGIACGYDAIPAIFESVSATSNTGLSSGVAGAGMPTVLEVVYIFQMWLGRLEFITFFAMLVEVFSFAIPRKRSHLRGRGQ